LWVQRGAFSRRACPGRANQAWFSLLVAFLSSNLSFENTTQSLFQNETAGMLQPKFKFVELPSKSVKGSPSASICRRSYCSSAIVPAGNSSSLKPVCQDRLGTDFKEMQEKERESRFPAVFPRTEPRARILAHRHPHAVQPAHRSSAQNIQRADP